MFGEDGSLLNIKKDALLKKYSEVILILNNMGNKFSYDFSSVCLTLTSFNYI